MICNHHNQSIFAFAFFPTDCFIDHLYNMVSVETIFLIICWIIYQNRCVFIQVGIGFCIGRIYIEFKVRHFKQLIPKFVLKIEHVAQMWINCSHNIYNGARGFVAFFAIFYLDHLIDQLLQMTTVFRNNQIFAIRIVF